MADIFARTESFPDEVAHHDEPPAADVEGPEQGVRHPVGHLPYAGGVPAEFVIVKVVDDDVVWTGLPIPEASRGLPAAAGQEVDAGLCRELALCPVPKGLLVPEVGEEALVELQLRLDVRQKADGGVLRLADHDHEPDEGFRLEHQP